MSNNRFLSKSNIYPTIWAIFLGLLGFLGALIWKSWTGPDEVIVLNNRENPKDTTVTIITFKPDKEYFEKITKLTSRDVEKQFTNTKSQDNQHIVDSLSISIVKEYQSKFDSIILSMNEVQNSNVNDKIISQSSENVTSDNSQIMRPKYRMPSIVEGYIQEKINPFATTSINNTDFNQKEKIRLSINFFNKSILDKITPLYVDIVEPKSANSVYQIWSEQYEIIDTKNMITFSADFKPGEYVLAIGIYLIDELNTKYPKFYLKKYSIKVK
jgi:hypothetical protein